MLCRFLIYVHPVPLEPPSPPTIPHSRSSGHHRVPGWAPCAVQQLPSSYIFYTQEFIYVNVTFSICSTLSFPCCVNRSVLYICTWRQPRCPSTDEWIKKMWYIYAMEYYSVMKRNETEFFVEMWMDLKCIIQSDVSQKEKNEHCMLVHICGI